jgi:O-antigen/teichoic acid export membrane protein
MEYKRIFKDGIHLLAGKVGTAIIGLVSLIILARMLTTEDMGKYSLFLMIINLALVLGLNWSDSSVVRHGREEHITNNKVNQTFWARMYLFVPILVTFSILFSIFSRTITNYIGIDSNLVYLVILVFVFNGVLNFINYLYQSTDKMNKSAYVLLSQKIFYLICLGIVLLGVFKANLTVALILLNVSFLLAVIFNIISFDFEKIRPYKFNKAYFKKIWAYSWPQLVGFPGLYAVNYIDIFVIKRYMTLANVGIYNIAYNAFTNISIIIIIIQTLFLPLLVEYRIKKKYGLIKNYVKNIPLYTFYWSIIVVLGLLASKYIIPFVFSTKYTLSVQPFNILLLATICYFVIACLLPLVNAFDYIIYSQIINLIYAGVNIIMDFILVPKMGIIGAAYGTLIAYFIRMVLLISLVYFTRHKILHGVNKR